MRLPLAMLLLAAGCCLCRAESPLAHIKVASPPYCSEISGNTKIEIVAPGFPAVEAKCWKQGEGQGTDASLGTIQLNSEGKGSFDFPADEFPHGPITIRISGKNPLGADNCYLQLYNKGGVSWNEGLPAEPPAAKGMKLVFSDDFDGPLSISSTDPKARYYDHKPPNGSQDFSTIPFRGFDEPNNPFAQVGTYLRIRADANKNSAGLISSLKNDGTGFTAKAPCYFECRFIAPNAIGTWPAFWLMTDYMAEHVKGLPDPPVDELDVIEGYGGEGPKSPNSFDLYRVTPHAWNQGEEGKALEKRAEEDLKNPISMRKFGIPSTWYEAPHTYGCKITEEETIYYLDNIEVGRHATLPESKKRPFFFLINLATGGGWPTDLSRYDGLTDMYVDWVRVYSGE
jgi:beta-glucanase (GH16 family)